VTADIRTVPPAAVAGGVLPSVTADDGVIRKKAIFVTWDAL
jgi:hypothetical protein